MNGGQAGAALIITLMLTTLLAFLGGALVFIMDIETATSANHQAAQVLRHAAESGIDCAIAELASLADWSPVPASPGSQALRCLDGTASPQTADGTLLDLPRLTGRRQADSDSRYGRPPATPDSPQWVLFARGPVWAAPGRSRPYILVWVADDVDDGDGQPLWDTNGVVMLRSQALGAGGARSAVEAVVARMEGAGPQASPVRLVAWREAE